MNKKILIRILNIIGLLLIIISISDLFLTNIDILPTDPTAIKYFRIFLFSILAIDIYIRMKPEKNDK